MAKSIGGMKSGSKSAKVGGIRTQFTQAITKGGKLSGGKR